MRMRTGRRLRRAALAPGAGAAAALVAVLAGAWQGVWWLVAGLGLAAAVLTYLSGAGAGVGGGHSSQPVAGVGGQSVAEHRPAGPGVSNLPSGTRLFVGRGRELEAVGEALRAGGVAAVVAVHGLGGVGKTQVALAYAHRSSALVRWWVNAADRDTAVADLAALAAVLGLPEQDDQRAAAISALREVSRRGRFLLVYDDAPGPEALAGLLPPAAAGGGAVITSRATGWDELATPVLVESLPTADAVDLLCQRSHDGDRDAAGELAGVLGGLPLALVQAGGYCAETGTTLAGYLAEYRRSAAILLRSSAPAGYPNPVAVTWAISLRQATGRCRDAAVLLRLLAYLAPAPLPLPLLSHPTVAAAPSPTVAALLGDRDRLANPVAALGGASLLTVDPGEIRVHQLVQVVQRQDIAAASSRRTRRLTSRVRAAVTRTDSSPGRPAGHWADDAIAIATALLDTARRTDEGTSQQREAVAAALPHIRAALGHADTLPTTPTTTAAAQLALAYVLWQLGDYRTARTLETTAHRTCQRVLGPDHPDTLASANNLAETRYALGELAGARELHEATYDTCQRVLGPDHPDTLASANNLAETRYALGELAGARELLQATYDTLQCTLGPEHPDTLASANNLAETRRALNDSAGVPDN